MGNEIYILDLLGTLTFAFYGAYVGMRRKFDIFGIFVVAFLTAVGGGTVREVILGHLPAYFSDMWYLVAIVLGIIFSILLYPVFSGIHPKINGSAKGRDFEMKKEDEEGSDAKASLTDETRFSAEISLSSTARISRGYFGRGSIINKYALIIDAIGLVTFAFIGASSAHTENLGAFAIILLATISAVGGGLLRDIAIAETPQIFYKDFYASPAIFLGILYVLCIPVITHSMVVYGIILASLALRLLAIYLKIDLWGPWRKS